MVTIKDIAREVGLSVTTVSRALSGYDDVAPATKARIRDVALRLDYHPNTAARSLQTTQADAIGLVIPSTLHRAYDPFWLEFIGGMAAVCGRSGLDLSLSAAEESEDSAEVPHSFARWVRGRRVDGLVVCDVRNEDGRITYLKRHRVPFVAFGRAAGRPDYPYIDVDGGAGVMQAVMHLATLGHTRIGYLGLDPSFGFSRFRLDGYQEGMSRMGLSYAFELVREGISHATAETVAAELCAMPQPPTAIVAAADFLALAVLRVARQRGLEVPGDLSLVVFDDNLLVQQAEPPLTVISQPNRRLGEEAAELLIERIRQPDGPLIQRLVGPTFIVRASTAPPRGLLPGAGAPLLGNGVSATGAAQPEGGAMRVMAGGAPVQQAGATSEAVSGGEQRAQE
jgi:DNA-binding LacI/PurR family transcriptional regulator